LCFSEARVSSIGAHTSPDRCKRLSERSVVCDIPQSDLGMYVLVKNHQEDVNIVCGPAPGSRFFLGSMCLLAWHAPLGSPVYVPI